MIKLTKRKCFRFFRSYYDVYNELETDKQKLDFINALLDRQFLGIKPDSLKGLAKFAYISQTNSIDSQVKGYEDKTKTKLFTPPTQPPTQPPCQQEKEKEKEKEKTTTIYDTFVAEVKNGEHAQAIEQWYMRLKIREGTLTPLLKEFKGQLIIDDTKHPNTLELRKHFNNWLNKQEQVGKLKQYK